MLQERGREFAVLESMNGGKPIKESRDEDLPLLQEAGSVKFLQSLSARRNQQPLRMPPEMLRDEGQEFDAAVADLEADHAWGTVARPLIDERRATIATMAGDERDSIERSAAAFQELTATERRNLATVASALADPKRDELRAAARFWHLIIAASDPPDRKNIVQLDPESRLEWLERRSRVREWMGERRGLPPAIEGGPMPQRVPGPGAMAARAGRVHAVKAGPRGLAATDGAAQSRGPGVKGCEPRAARGASASVHGQLSRALSFQRICREAPSPQTFLREKLKQRPIEDLRRLQRHEMARGRHDQELGIRDDLLSGFQARRGRDLILGTHHEQRRHPDVPHRLRHVGPVAERGKCPLDRGHALPLDHRPQQGIIFCMAGEGRGIGVAPCRRQETRDHRIGQDRLAEPTHLAGEINASRTGLGRVGFKLCVDEYDAPYTVGMPRCHVLRHVAPHRHTTDHGRPLHVERLEHRGHVVGELGNAARDRAARPKSPQVGRDQSDGIRERRLPRPHAVVEGEGVEEHHREPATGRVDGQSRVADVNVMSVHGKVEQVFNLLENGHRLETCATRGRVRFGT